MLYFKTRKDRLIIKIDLDDEGPHKSLFMLICLQNDTRRNWRYYQFVDEKVWEKLLKISSPSILEDNLVDYQAYIDSVDNQDTEDQYNADQDWLMMKADQQMWRESVLRLMQNGVKPLLVF